MNVKIRRKSSTHTRYVGVWELRNVTPRNFTGKFNSFSSHLASQHSRLQANSSLCGLGEFTFFLIYFHDFPPLKINNSFSCGFVLSLFFTFTNPTGEYFNTWNSGEILGVLLRGGGNGSDNLWNFSARSSTRCCGPKQCRNVVLINGGMIRRKRSRERETCRRG